MRATLKAYYAEQMMQPGLVGLFVNPFYFARKALYRAMKEFGRDIRGRVLDVGCGARPYEHLVQATHYVGLEIPGRKSVRADVLYGGGGFPFADCSFDAVICNQVLEHVFRPDAFLREIARVLTERGRLLVTVPFVWDEHEQPRDYARYSSFGLAALLQQNGFSILQQRKTAGDARVLFQLLNAYLYKLTATRNPYVNFAAALLLMAPVNVLGSVVALIAPRNPDLFLDNVVLAERNAAPQ